MPDPYAVAIALGSSGSSEYPSSLRPQRGSRSRLTTGAHRLRPQTTGFSALKPRASSPTTDPTRLISAGSQVLAMPTACGNAVPLAVTTFQLSLRSLDQATPCRASV